MARQLMALLSAAGYVVSLASELRSFLRSPDDQATRDRALAQAEDEIQRLDAVWRTEGPPDLWVCYHPYYKAPDLIGPDLCERHGVPWITIEASQSRRRGTGLWDDWQARARRSVSGARVNIAMTRRDADGLREMVPGARIARLAPFIEADALLSQPRAPELGHLVCVAMMRPGDKSESYAMLADALARLTDPDWHLTIAGDGEARAEIERLFGSCPRERVSFAGRLDPPQVADLLSRGSIYVWPGYGEAYGLAYLEAQAAGLPVVAQAIAGVPEVVEDGVTGVLTPPGDSAAMAAAVARLLRSADLREEMGANARARVRERHGFGAAAQKLRRILEEYVEGKDA